MILVAASTALLGGTVAATEADVQEQGEQIFAERCAQCHQLHPYGVSPGQLELTYFPVEERERFERVVRRGQGIMPPAGEDLDEAEMDALWAYFEDVVGSLPE